MIDFVVLAQCDPLSAIGHPECHTEIWWQLAVNHPFSAIQSPLYPLFLLENPGRWMDLVKKYADIWIRRWCVGSESTYRQRQSFAADCIEHVLPQFEREYPQDLRPRRALAARRRYAAQTIPQEEFSNVCEQSHRCAEEIIASLREDERSLASGVAYAAGWMAPDDAVESAAAVRWDNDDLSIEETLWQWNRLLFYALPSSQTQGESHV